MFEAVFDPDIGRWLVDGIVLGPAPEAGVAEWVLGQVVDRLSAPGPWPVRIWDGETVLELVIGVDGSVSPAPSMGLEPVASDLVVVPTAEPTTLMEGRAVPGPRRRRALVLGGALAVVLLAGGVAAAAVLGNGAAATGQSAAPVSSSVPQVPVLWQVQAAPGEVSYAGHGVLVSADGGVAEVRSLVDGRSLGTVKLPGPVPRLAAGAGWIAVVATAPDGTNTGLVATGDSIKEFSGVKGSLVQRGVDPFFLTGTGKDQGALVWDGASWKPVPAPEPGMAPVAASPSGVVWLGAGGRLVSSATSATLATPVPGAKTAGWVWADEKSVAVLWDTTAGKVLAVHGIGDGKITGQAPAGEAGFSREGGLVLSGGKVFTFGSGVPVASAECPEPVMAGDLLWCRAENTWAAPGAGPLAQGQTPVPSSGEVVVTASEDGFTAYARDELKSDQNNPKEQ